MSEDIEQRIWHLELWLRLEINKIEADTMKKFRTLARSTGQRTRANIL